MKTHTYHYNMFTDGITQSMISLWLTCREQCRLGYVEGYTGTRPYMPFIFGNTMHHMMEHIYRLVMRKKRPITSKEALQILGAYHLDWMQNNGSMSDAGKELQTIATGLAKTLLPHYCNNAFSMEPSWADHKRKWIMLEHNFIVPTRIHGEIVPLRGRMDGVFIQKRKGKKYLWLFETKNYSYLDIDELFTSLHVNFQVMFYLSAMQYLRKKGLLPRYPIAGVLYNVIHRPTNRKSAKENVPTFLRRVEQCVNKHPQKYFHRLPLRVSEEAVYDWKQANLIPILKQMVVWYRDLQTYGHVNSPSHYMNPFGLMTKYGPSEYYNLIVRNSDLYYTRRPTPFSELK